MPVYFKNPGIAILEALTTMGVNVKEDSSAIGHFGTGFKFGTGIVMRLGGSLTVYLGLDKYEFFTKTREIRGKEFQLVHVRHPDGHEQSIGITSEVGKNWQPWMAYREFRCNAQDESGFTSDKEQEPEEGYTLIVVDSRDIELVHAKADDYFITTEPVHELEELDLHYSHKQTNKIFYKGVRVGQWELPSMFRYNFKSGLMLTEDRTITSEYYTSSSLRRSLAACTNKQLLYKIFTADHELMEHHIKFDSLTSASEQFLDTAELVLKQKPLHYNVTLRATLSKLRNHDPFEWIKPSLLQSKMLVKAEKVCLDFGFDTSTRDIRIVDNLGVDVLGCVDNGNIYLSVKAFDMGTKVVAGTLLEEMIHAQRGLRDCTRELQNFLLDRLMTTYEEKTGEPL